MTSSTTVFVSDSHSRTTQKIRDDLIVPTVGIGFDTILRFAAHMGFNVVQRKAG